jgi:hypothetical protein
MYYTCEILHQARESIIECTPSSLSRSSCGAPMSARTRGAITVAARDCTKGGDQAGCSSPPPPSSVRARRGALSFCISAHGRATTFWDHLTTTSQFRATLLDHTLRILLCHAKMRFMRHRFIGSRDSP